MNTTRFSSRYGFVFAAILALPWAAHASSALQHFSAPAGNVLPVTIAGQMGSVNTPFVSITLCQPGSDICQTIDNIELDTGSTGLRVFSSVVKLDLKTESASNGKQIAECLEFGGGDGYWGPIKTADIVLGGETAPNLPVQLIDRSFGSLPAACANADANPTAMNGVFGLKPAKTDCEGASQCDSGTYFSCNGTACTDISSNMPVALQLSNPVAHLPRDNNGYIITFPAIPDSGAARVSGTLTLGIGTEDNNAPPTVEGTKPVVLPANSDGVIQAQIGDNLYPAVLDTGTFSWNFPTNLGLPACAADSPAGSDDLCPSVLMAQPVSLLGINSAARSSFTVKIDNAENQLATYGSPNVAFENLAGDGDSQFFLAGIPFFLGRTVYFGIDGQKSPLGAGPFYAY